MQIRCPHCESSIPVETDSALDRFSCSSCGGKFQLYDEDDSATAVPPTLRRLGHFELLEQLGKGGQGTVWKARDVELERIVAIKIPRADRLTGAEAESFLREARTAAQLQHPHIVTVHEIGRQDDLVYIVTDFIPGRTLESWLREFRPTVRESVQFCVAVADALQYAHSVGVVHRDLKPANIMMGEANEPHIMDFGLAKRAVPDMTITANGMVMGTPAYMPPEQALGELQSTDCRSDVYSLGVTLFELLTGEVPFRGNYQMLLQQVIHDDPPSPRKLNGTIPVDLETICLKCLEKEPGKRFATARDLSDELSRFLRGEPILSRRITWLPRAWRWCKRNPVVSSLAAILMLTMLLGLAGVTTQWLRAQHFAEQAQGEAERATLAAGNERDARQRTSRYLYVAHMNLVQQAAELSDPERMTELLQRHIPPAENAAENTADDQRGFEWYYWWRQCHRWSHTFQEHTGPIYAVALSPDGELAATAGKERVIRVWRVANGEEVAQLAGHTAQIFSLAFSPDGQTLASGSEDKTIKIWNVADRSLKASWSGHKGTVFALSFATDGQHLASASSDTTVKIWDVEKQEVTQTLQGHIDFVYAVAFSPDGKLVASAGLDRTIRLWDLSSGEARELLGHTIEVWSVAFSPTGQTLASASGDKTIRIWNVERGAVTATLTGHTDRVRAVAFLGSENTLVSTGADRTLRWWDLTQKEASTEVNVRRLNRRPVHFFERQNDQSRKLSQSLLGHANSANALAVSSDGKRLVTAGEDQVAKVWNVASLQETDQLRRHDRSITAVTFSNSGQVLISASNDETIRRSNLVTGLEMGVPFRHASQVWSLALSPDNDRLASGCTDGTVNLWQMETGERTVLGKHAGPVSGMAFSPDGQHVASASHDKSVRIWKLSVAAEQQPRILPDHAGQVHAVTFLPDGQTVATASADGLIRLWSWSTESAPQILTGHRGSVWCLAVSPDGKLLASGSEDGEIKLWRLPAGGLVQTLQGHAALVQSVTFSPDSQTLASGGGDKLIKLWDVATGEQKTTLKGHDYRVWSVAFSPQGDLLASGSYELLLWRTKEPADK